MFPLDRSSRAAVKTRFGGWCPSHSAKPRDRGFAPASVDRVHRRASDASKADRARLAAIVGPAIRTRLHIGTEPPILEDGKIHIFEIYCKPVDRRKPKIMFGRMKEV